MNDSQYLFKYTVNYIKDYHLLDDDYDTECYHEITETGYRLISVTLYNSNRLLLEKDIFEKLGLTTNDKIKISIENLTI